MKTIAKISVCLLFVGAANLAFAQQQKSKPAAKQTSKKTKAQKGKTGIDNKIAVSDDAQTADKGTKGNKTVKSGISNK